MKPTKKPTNKPTNKPTIDPITGPPSACSTPHGCTAEMLDNAYCDLRCHIPECNHDNGKCGGYIHIEYVGDKNEDPRIMPAIMEAARQLNRVIKPEAQLPYRESNTNVCGWNTNTIPANLQVNQLIIVAGHGYIDGPGGALAWAGPCSQRNRDDGTRYTIDGQLAVESESFIDLLDRGLYVGMLMHEAGHALGIGTLWGRYNLIDNQRWDGSTENVHNTPTYNGYLGNAYWRQMGGSGDVPIEDDNGRGTADGHWEEDVFGSELMTGWLSTDPMAISKVTLGSLADMGIAVDFNRADDFRPDFNRRLRGSLARDLGDEKENWIPTGHDVIMPKSYVEVHLEDGTVQYDPVF